METYSHAGSKGLLLKHNKILFSHQHLLTKALSFFGEILAIAPVMSAEWQGKIPSWLVILEPSHQSNPVNLISLA